MTILLVSMEAALWNEVPTYAGGLGILVGDKIRAAQDTGLKMDALTFSYPQGYIKHKIEDGKVIAEPNPYNPKKKFKSAGSFEADTKFGKIPWELLKGENSWFVHTDFAEKLYIENSQEDRLKKEIILGKAAAQVFSDKNYDILHIEESNAAFSGEEVRRAHPKKRIVFTTHTPLPYGHEKWEGEIAKSIYGKEHVSMTETAMKSANYVNCVSRMQRDIMNPYLGGRADYITNGVHVGTWMHPVIKKLVKNCVGDIEKSPEKLANAVCINTKELKEARSKINEQLVKKVNSSAFKNMDFEAGNLTVSIARRFTGYKRLDMILSEFSTLEGMAKNKPIQIIFAGMAHPLDVEGLKTIEKVISIAGEAKNVKIAYFPEYNMDLAKTMIAGSDLWLNVPQEEREASGTSWMKAMMNGTVLVSTVSGSVPEYSINRQNSLLISPGDYRTQSKQLLEHINYALRTDTSEISRGAITAASHLTARRMIMEYESRAYSK
ncbi:MAG: glycosyltransferase [Candidatus Altiarchaeota archaeon]|nr:glycosyltransferase [Candidatus Altiarchaeota archaeon]